MALVPPLYSCVLHWIVARLSGLWSRDPDLWVFGARDGQAFTDNAKYLYLHIAANHPEVRPVWLSKNRKIVRDLRARGYEAHYTYSLRGLRLNLRAGVVCVTHGLQDVSVACSGGARAVMLWHGTPLKHILLDAYFRDYMIRTNGYGPLKHISWDAHPFEALSMRLSHSYVLGVFDRLTVPAEATMPSFASAFGIEPDGFALTGYPRNDALFEAIPDADIGLDMTAYRAVEELAADERVVLYLPTFRDTGEGALGALDIPALAEILERHDAYLLVKTHPWDPLEPGSITTDRVRVLPEATDSHALLPLADVLVADYSSVFFDYLLLDRPMMFYAHDLDSYRADRGFYYDYDEVTPGPTARTVQEFHDALEDVLGSGTDEFADERARVRERFCCTHPNRSEAVYEAVRNVTRNRYDDI